MSLGAVIPDATEASVSAAFGLKDYIPVVSGTPHHILCCGDVLGTDRTEHSNQTQSEDGLDPNSVPKFDGLVEAPQEFQKEHLFHEVRKTLSQ